MTLRELLPLVLLAFGAVFCASCANSDVGGGRDAGPDGFFFDGSFIPSEGGGGGSGSLPLGPLGSTGDCSNIEVEASSFGSATVVVYHPDPLGCIKLPLLGTGSPTSSYVAHEKISSGHSWRYSLTGLEPGSLTITFKNNVADSSNDACKSPPPESTIYTCTTTVL